MSLKGKLEEDMRQALKVGDKLKLSVLRLVRASIRNREIDKRRALTDEDIIDVISSSIKQRIDSVREFTRGGRNDLINKEEAEIEILKSYLPQPLSEEELREIVDETIKTVEAKDLKDLGRVMGALMPKVKGRAEGKIVNQMVRERLGGVSLR